MIYARVNECIASERERGLGEATCKELSRYLHEFADYCHKKVDTIAQITPDFLRDYVLNRGKGLGPDLIKAVVWSLRKFGAFLVLRDLVSKNPARPLRHPKRSPRKELPQYLRSGQLRTLLQSMTIGGDKRDFAILSLICSTGMRPSSVAGLKRYDLIVSAHYVLEHGKGGGYKRTTLSSSLAAILLEYLSSRTDDFPAFFLNDRGRPVSKSWIQRVVKMSGEKAGFNFPITCNLLRHTFAVHAADRHGKGMTKALMGHRKLSTTAVYTHLSARYFRDFMNQHPYINNGGHNGSH